MVALEVVTVYLKSLSDPHTVDVLHCGDTVLTYVRQWITGGINGRIMFLTLASWMLDQGSYQVIVVTPTFWAFAGLGRKVVNEFYY